VRVPCVQSSFGNTVSGQSVCKGRRSPVLPPQEPGSSNHPSLGTPGWSRRLEFRECGYTISETAKSPREARLRAAAPGAAIFVEFETKDSGGVAKRLAVHEERAGSEHAVLFQH